MSKRVIAYDWRGVPLHECDSVLVREPFPKSGCLTIGMVEKARKLDDDSYEVKIIKGKWYKKPLKLADK